ncbi:MAG: DUF4139 domain-containing protein [Candidatus Methanoplasma sp.]|jgi:uncharacterized protein (TIGR02231 family)|nr:DUF4139 domain-containing protein [Candidatus Methanoplasma sp.]
MATSTSVRSVVERATVFLRGADIARRTQIDVKEGKNTAVFAGLPASVDIDSINASVASGGELVRVSHRRDNFVDSQESKRISKLRARLEGTLADTARAEARVSELVADQNFLAENRRIVGEGGVRPEELKEIFEYHRSATRDILSRKIEAEKALKDLKQACADISAELGSAGRGKTSVSVSVEINAERSGTAEIVLSYLVPDAHWTPHHELRVSDDGRVRLTSKGDIVQNTGEDWTDVNVSLSSGNPATGGNPPILHPWSIDVYSPPQAIHGRSKKMALSMEPAQGEYELADMAVFESSSCEKKAVEVREGDACIEFELPLPLSIPSGDDPYTVELAAHDLKADLQHYCVAKEDKDVFLLAKITGWESLNLLRGETGIFQGNTFIGRTRLDPARATDALEISMGRDFGVLVKREKGNDLSSKASFGKNNKAVREWNTTVTNTRNREIEIRLVDQIPVSVNKSVTVEPVELSGANLDKETGEVVWVLKMPAGGSINKTLSYEVSYPKDSTVLLE